MKRILLAPLLLTTLLVGCGNTDKTFNERRDDCAEWEGQIISHKEFIDKYKIGSRRQYSWENLGEWRESRSAVRHFCSFYRIGNIKF